MEHDILKKKKLDELKEIAKTFGIPNYYKLKKDELIEALKNNSEAEEVEETVEATI